jgi:outer membrane receptor protein involved in Fe transport
LRAGRTDGSGVLDDWNTLNLTLSKELKLPKTGPLSFSFSVRNLLDCRYEISSGYPMPGRSLIGGVEYLF